MMDTGKDLREGIQNKNTGEASVLKDGNKCSSVTERGHFSIFWVEPWELAGYGLQN